MRLVFDDVRGRSIGFFLLSTGELKSFYIETNLFVTQNKKVEEIEEIITEVAQNETESTEKTSSALNIILKHLTWQNQSILVTIIVSVLFLLIVGFLIILIIGSLTSDDLDNEN